MFNFGAWVLFSYCPFNLSSFCLLFLQFLFNVIALLYHCLIELGYHSDSINLQCIVLFMPLLNSFTKGLSLYLLPLVALLNSCTNSSIILLPCSNLFNSATLTIFSSFSLNYFLISAKNFPTILYSNSPSSKSFSVFSFYTFANSLCTYNKIYCIYFSTIISLILILIYNLYAMINLNIFLELLLNSCSLATLICILGLTNTTTSSFSPSSAWAIMACRAANCSYCCWTICF